MAVVDPVDVFGVDTAVSVVFGGAAFAVSVVFDGVAFAVSELEKSISIVPSKSCPFNSDSLMSEIKR